MRSGLSNLFPAPLRYEPLEASSLSAPLQHQRETQDYSLHARAARSEDAASLEALQRELDSRQSQLSDLQDQTETDLALMRTTLRTKDLELRRCVYVRMRAHVLHWIGSAYALDAGCDALLHACLCCCVFSLAALVRGCVSACTRLSRRICLTQNHVHCRDGAGCRTPTHRRRYGQLTGASCTLVREVWPSMGTWRDCHLFRKDLCAVGFVGFSRCWDRKPGAATQT